MTTSQTESVHQALDHFQIEIPSWAFADTGTRFGKFLQDAAAIDIEDKLADAGQVHRLTGICPTVATHVAWDFKDHPPATINGLAAKHGVKLGAINPTMFERSEFKYGSVCHSDEFVRQLASEHLHKSLDIANAVGSKLISFWMADGSNYPGQANIRARKQWMIDVFRELHQKLAADQRLLLEYKPFEPAFYHTDLADWGMAYATAKQVGEKAQVLVDIGHHYAGQNIEQIVAWLLDLDMLGGFHLNDRRYADDDLVFASIDPYQAFRIFHEIQYFGWEKGGMPALPYMIDQSHIDKPKITAMIQTAMAAQIIFAKAALVDHGALALAQKENDQIRAEELVKDAFGTDVRPILIEWRRGRGLPENPLKAFQASGYQETAANERRQRRKEMGTSSTSSFA